MKIFCYLSIDALNKGLEQLAKNGIKVTKITPIIYQEQHVFNTQKLQTKEKFYVETIESIDESTKFEK